MIWFSVETLHDTLMVEISAQALHVPVSFRWLFIAVLLSLYCHGYAAMSK